MPAWSVQSFSQTTISLCWEACARMLWHWKNKSLNGYSQKAGKFLTVKTGLTEQQMDSFYKSLGLRSLTPAQGKNVRYALQWSPVIFTDINKAFGHAMVASGFNQGVYSVVNPCTTMSVDFDKNMDTCTAGTLQRAQAEVDEPFGSIIWYW